ncbi:uncharacterized protein LOC111439027 [Cucurbita moschata]|uniref:Uncharacterized protein LOC111439027 n=1 Tax=Cucurbita moschata TaxID=3662 RepID=A0A6J1F1Z6_CUCMO|nr:uncharacterized protein LOC111439027 [Cucurbita moschata]
MTLAVIYQAVLEDVLLMLAEKDSANAAWEMLQTMHVGVERVKEAKLQTLKSEFEAICMKHGGTEETSDQPSASESHKKQAQQEAEKAKKQLSDMYEESQQQHAMDAAALASAMNEVQRLKIQLNMVSESNETRSNLTKSVENLQSDGIKAVEAYNSLSLKLEQSKDHNSWREGKMPERVFDENRRKKDEGNSSSGGGGSRPKLNLQPRTLLVNDVKSSEISGMTARSKSSNPFGEARLREEVLAEKGQDWKKLDEELESKIIEVSGEKTEKSNPIGKKSFGKGTGQAAKDKTKKSWREAEFQ